MTALITRRSQCHFVTLNGSSAGGVTLQLNCLRVFLPLLCWELNWPPYCSQLFKGFAQMLSNATRQIVWKAIKLDICFQKCMGTSHLRASFREKQYKCPLLFWLSLFYFLTNFSLYLFVIFPFPFFITIFGLITFLNNSFKTQISKRFFLNCQEMDKIEIKWSRNHMKKSRYFPRLPPCMSVFKC